MTQPAALFVFAHQDDEMAAVSRIVFERTRGANIWCVFLTDGSSKASAEIRNRESLAVLSSLGILTNQIAFIGTEIPIEDGTLVHHLDVALERLEQRVSAVAFDTIYCLAWEGGHQDHDASHLVATAFAKRRGMLDRCFEMPLYHGAGTPRSLFRVMAPVAPRRDWSKRRLTFREGFSLAMLAWRYPSQRSSWMGLFPETFLKLAILRREVLRKVDPSRFRERPHRGLLFYERRFRFPYDRFTDASAGFVEAEFR